MMDNLVYVMRLEDSKNGSFSKGHMYQAYEGQESYKVKDNNGKWKFAPKSKFEDLIDWDRQ